MNQQIQLQTPETDISPYQAGDILFFAQGNGSIGDGLIRLWTGSKLVHCAIAVSGAQKIEALVNGVVKTPINTQAVAACWHVAQHNIPANNLNYGLSWLQSQLGQMYGWGDIVDDILWKFEHGLAFDVGDHFDCSALATEFLLKVGSVPGLESITDVHVVTPGELASLLGVPQP